MGHADYGTILSHSFVLLFFIVIISTWIYVVIFDQFPYHAASHGTVFPELLFGHSCWDHTTSREWNSNSHHLCLTTGGYVACKMLCYDFQLPEHFSNIYKPKIHGLAMSTQSDLMGIALRWCSTTDISSAPDGTGFLWWRMSLEQDTTMVNEQMLSRWTSGTI